jgi:D-aminopeptidase
MSETFRRVLIIADIEGSSGCWSYRASSFMTPEWARACVAMSRDVQAVAQALFECGVEYVRVKDFHRTGYNLLPELIDARAELIQGYRAGPVPGLGDPGPAEAVMFLGMHAASGTDGFLAHTLTSRIRHLEVNGNPLPEIQLFAASLAGRGIKPIFFSGCPVACAQARTAIRHISVFPIDKFAGQERVDAIAWRTDLAQAAVTALNNKVRMQTGSTAARKIARRWGLVHQGDQIVIDANDIHDVYMHLIRICYLTPFIEKTLPLGLRLYNLWGRLGLAWVRRQQKRIEPN